MHLEHGLPNRPEFLPRADRGRYRSSASLDQTEPSGGNAVESKEHARPAAPETQRLIEWYTSYRFGAPLAPADLAGKAGVPVQAVEDLRAGKPVDAVALARIAAVLGVSTRLLQEIAGYRPMSDEMRRTLNGFFTAIRQRNRRLTAPGRHGVHAREAQARPPEHA
jgi:transcriptional regulator with XRE-family HTH domain